VGDWCDVHRCDSYSSELDTQFGENVGLPSQTIPHQFLDLSGLIKNQVSIGRCVRVKRLDRFRETGNFLLEASPTPDGDFEPSTMRPKFFLESASNRLNVGVVGRRRSKDKFADIRPELFSLLYLAAQLRFGNAAAIVGILALALDTNIIAVSVS